ncbi:Cupredoxin [Armillaria luteobubalina]|uniref:Cupredoxin n=1 Tax=Armillaria luteobubalina TaxID=153913 RepID=A0AA39PLT4_9AGAR|nr:Cupredoxin [Armillaria luteobubalina]
MPHQVMKLMSPSFFLIAAILPAAVYATTYDVTVGANGELAYNPEYVTASAGDTINFIFNPKNHTVTRSSFNAPCVHLTDGVDSGFMPVNADQVDKPTFQLLVNDTNPVWVYCRQTGHCGKGMVFAVNPGAEGSSNSFSTFKALAISSNGTTSSSSATSTYTTPPAPSWTTATATVTRETSVWLTIYTSYDGTPSPTFPPQPVDHKIVVGIDGKLEYSPANISASVGDTVTFEFHPNNHTVTQSSFQNPCQPLAETSTSGQTGFSSGFRPVAANATEFPTYQIKINDTAPVWGYCGQTNHCGSGMVFSINAVETGANNFAAFKELAIHTNGTAAGSSGNGSSGSGSSSSTASASAPSPSGSDSGSGSNNGAVSFSGDIGLGAIFSALVYLAILM